MATSCQILSGIRLYQYVLMCEPAQSAVVTHIDMVLRLRLILEFPVMRFRCREGFKVPEVIFRIPDHIWRRHLHKTSFTPLGGCCHYALECGGGARVFSALSRRRRPPRRFFVAQSQNIWETNSPSACDLISWEIVATGYLVMPYNEIQQPGWCNF